MNETLWIGALSLAAVVALAFAFVLRRRSRQRRGEAAHAEAVSKNLHIPASLHPVIDPDRCIGSLSCLQACPEGDILGVVDGRAKLITAANCIGHGKCALECPVDAIKLVFGTSERGVDLPDVDEFFESSRPGVHIVGELGGMGLIRNAIRQGLQCAERLAATLPKAPPPPEVVDVAIVGAGPAGLSTALGLRAQNRSFRVLEQGRFGGTIAHYPRQKVVMTETVELPLYGKFAKRLISKEELLATWTRVANKAAIQIDEGMKVSGLEGTDGAFVLQTSGGRIAARKVVLATGRRGSPRKLGVPGEELEKVTYGLDDPEQYGGARVLVVGGGDAALEAAIQLTEQTDAEVTLSYRGEALGRCREANRQKFNALVEARRLRALLPSQVTRIIADAVDVDVRGESTRLPNDYVLVNIGGELPLEMLKAMGVALVRHHGTAPGENPARPGARATFKVKRPAHQEEEARKDRRLAWSLFTLGAVIVAGLLYVGWDYYALPRLERRRAPMHEFLRPAGLWGHGIGIVATAVMLSNFLYSVRKRLRWLKGTAPIRRWLTFHVFVGFMSPVVIAFHAAFQSNNVLATATASSLGVVVFTGMIGRFVYGLVPTRDGRTLELPHVTANWERLKSRIEPMLTGIKDPHTVRRVLDEATAPPATGSLFLQVLSWPFQSLRTRWHVRRLRRLFPDPAQHRELRDVFLRLARLRVQVGFYRGLKRFMSVWRIFHVVLAVLLVVMIAGHIGLSLYLGYGWILF